MNDRRANIRLTAVGLVLLIALFYGWESKIRTLYKVLVLAVSVWYYFVAIPYFIRAKLAEED